MTSCQTGLFPFPHFNKSKQIDGSIIDWPQICKSCKSNACQKTRSDEIQICSYGYNFLKATDTVTIGGVVLKDFSITNKARKKRIQENKNRLILEKDLIKSACALQQTAKEIENEMQKEKEQIIRRYLKDRQYEKDFLQPLKERIQKGLSFVHDYKQINTAIRQNINVIIEKRYSGPDIDTKISQAEVEERAIYEASRFLDEKLNVAKFLLHPEWLREQDACIKFKFHGILMKYRHIYTPLFIKKNLKVSVAGQSFLEMIANPQAVQVIPHTFLDNATKYSPNGQKIEIHVQDSEDVIHFSVSSYGPIIGAKDSDRIFSPFFRTKSAEKMVEEGAGYGLFISQSIATKHLGTVIKMKQDKQDSSQDCYWTTFSVDLPLEAIIL